MAKQRHPEASDPSVRLRMERQRQRDTKPEVALRAELWRRGLRYRVDYRVVGRRRPDIVFTRVKVAVFVDGCFWHSCPQHETLPKANQQWWREKLEGNVARDRAADLELRAAGWAVLRVWEHEPVNNAADRIEQLVRDRRSSSGEEVSV